MRESTLLPQGELELQGCHNLLHDFILQSKNVFQRPVIALGPQVIVLGGINQLGSDAHLSVGLAYAAFQHVPYTQLFAQFWYFYCLPFVKEGGVTRNDKEARDTGEGTGEVLGDTIAKILLLRVAAHV